MPRTETLPPLFPLMTRQLALCSPSSQPSSLQKNPPCLQPPHARPPCPSSPSHLSGKRLKPPLRPPGYHLPLSWSLSLQPHRSSCLRPSCPWLPNTWPLMSWRRQPRHGTRCQCLAHQRQSSRRRARCRLSASRHGHHWRRCHPPTFRWYLQRHRTSYGLHHRNSCGSLALRWRLPRRY